MAPHHWRFLNTGWADGPYNMALDEAILVACQRHQVPPTVRVYGWMPATVSIGYTQDPVREIDLDRCRAAGYGLVRRPTGGRAVLHDQELTYSFIAPQEEAGIGRSILETYRITSQALLVALTYLGVHGELARATPVDGHKGGGLCFSSAARFEVLVQGRKLIGSAQRRTARMVLQHGSILLDSGHEKLAGLLARGNPAAQQRLTRLLKTRTISLAEVLQRPVSFAELASSIRAGFGKRLGLVLEEDQLTATEEQLVSRLIREKYGTDEWNLHYPLRNSSFLILNSKKCQKKG